MLPATTADEYSLHNLFSVNIFLGLTSVVYRLPGQKQAHFLSGNLQEAQQEIPPGSAFLVSPFQANNTIYAILPQFRQAIKSASNSNPDVLEIPFGKTNLPAAMPKEKYTSIVQKAVAEIGAGKLEKVVLSRAHKTALPHSFNPLNFFLDLTEKYPDAFVYLLMSPELGNWIAATPELLLHIRGQQLETVALAGTRHISTGEKMLSTDFTPKETHEQDVVTHYINNELQPFAKEINISRAQIKKAGNLLHLQTSIGAKLKDKNWLPLIKNLHPTPAVGGIPLQAAKDFITENETYDRALYSGFLGDVDDAGNANLYVNLRCMQFNQTEAAFYAGAGIVKGSDPEKEWQETEHKMRTLLDVLEIN